MELRIWLAVLTTAVILKGVATLYLNRRDSRIEQAILRVERMLFVWADNWDSTPQIVKAKLLAVRRDHL